MIYQETGENDGVVKPERMENWPVERLIPYARNARTHSDAQIAQIAASIVEFGFANPILIDSKGGLIAGHGRLLAARKLGLTAVPVVILDHLSETQKRAYILADNRLALSAGWDEELLQVELQALREADFDLELTGFDDEELTRLLADEESVPGLTDEDAVPDVPERAISVTGDIWILGSHRLLCGDATVATDVTRVLNGVSPTLMATDPPYGVAYDPQWRAVAGVNQNRSKLGKVQNDDRADWRDAWALFPGDVMYVWHAGRYAATVQQSIEVCGFEIRSQIIWGKDRFALSRGNYHWQHEPCWYAVRNNAHWNGDRSQSTLWAIKAREDTGHGHGTQKPVECMRRPMLNNSSPGQAVYDPFLGSGTSIIAAETCGRVCYGVEINPIYCDLILKRWEQFSGKIATLENSGQSFAQVAQTRESAVS